MSLHAYERVTVQDGEVQVAFRGTEQPERVSREEALAWLDAKEASHRERGWDVRRGEDGHVEATRTYEDSGVTKRRTMFVREVD